MIKNDIEYYINILFDKDVSIEEYGDDAYIYRLFKLIFGQVPHVMYFFTGIDEEDDLSGEFELDETEKRIKEEVNCTYYSWKDRDIILGDRWIEFKGTIYCLDPKVPDELSKRIMLTKKDTANLIFVSVSSKGGIIQKLLPVNEVDIDYNINYNADFPHERIEEIINDNKSGLILTFGLPGTGKTSYLRKMIKDNPKVRFYWLDSSMFNMINSTEFIEFLLDCKGGVFILEDCESLLKDRNIAYNNLITPILNISDGMLGDSLKLKFICTFNTDLSNIDSALLRKGRLSLQYEFKNLSKDRVQKLFDKLNIKVTATKDMPLCDIYNYLQDNGKKEKKKVGF